MPDDNLRCRWCLLVLFAMVLFIAGVGNCLALVNFRNDPDLAKAMEYDSELTHDKSLVDRELAEKYYLIYLEKETESWQKAQIYAQLGAIHLTALNREKGEMPDRETGRQYFEKVLELEPERIGRATYRARTMLASLGETRGERLRANMEVYEWMQGVDEEEIINNWLPTEPSNTKPTPLQLRKTISVFETIDESLSINIAVGAWGMEDGKKCLNEVKERFPGTLAAEHADEKLSGDARPVRKNARRLSSAEISHPPNIVLMPELKEEQIKLVEESTVNNVVAVTEGSRLQHYAVITAVVVCIVAGLVVVSRGKRT